MVGWVPVMGATHSIHYIVAGWFPVERQLQCPSNCVYLIAERCYVC